MAWFNLNNARSSNCSNSIRFIVILADDHSNVHPYHAEIMALLNNPRLELKNRPDDKDLKMKDAYVWVETEFRLKELADLLAKERVIAVDTEQHSLRSYLGFTALMQVIFLSAAIDCLLSGTASGICLILVSIFLFW